MAVKLAKAMGGAVTVFNRSADKVEDAKCFGASSIVIDRDGADLKALEHAFDFARDTVLSGTTAIVSSRCSSETRLTAGLASAGP